MQIVTPIIDIGRTVYGTFVFNVTNNYSSGSGGTGSYTGITLNGDVTGVGVDVIGAYLSFTTVNSGVYGSASSVGGFTVDPKGRIISANNIPIIIPQSSVTNLTTDLALKSNLISPYFVTPFIGNATGLVLDLTGLIIRSGLAIKFGNPVSGQVLTAFDSDGTAIWQSGAQGLSGWSGFSGYSGYSGVSGWSGFNGAIGPSGNDGISGYSGYSGFSGISGWSGYSGLTGAIGATGISGFSGISGYSGYSGISGWSGISGFSGQNGVGGSTGPSPFQFGLNFGDGVNIISSGFKGWIRNPYSGVITGWSLVADVTGVLYVDIWKSTYDNFPPTSSNSIVGGVRPFISGQMKNNGANLSTWISGVTIDDWFAYNIESNVSGVKMASLAVYGYRI